MTLGLLAACAQLHFSDAPPAADTSPASAAAPTSKNDDTTKPAQSGAGTVPKRVPAPAQLRPPQRLFVVENIGDVLGGESDIFHAKLAAAIESCDVTADFAIRPPSKPTLRLDAAPSYDRQAEIQQMQAFQPDAVLGISQFSTFSTNSGAQKIGRITYDLELLDRPSRQIVWSGKVTLDVKADAGSTLAEMAMAQLTKASVLHNCGGAKSEKPAAPPTPPEKPADAPKSGDGPSGN